MSLLGDGELAVTEGVPELDRAVAGSRYDLSVVGREGDRQNIVGVSDETAGGGTGGKLPEAESLVPGGRESVGTVRRDHLTSSLSTSFCALPTRRTYAIRHDVFVSLERSLGDTVRGFIPSCCCISKCCPQSNIFPWRRSRNPNHPQNNQSNAAELDVLRFQMIRVLSRDPERRTAARISTVCKDAVCRSLLHGMKRTVGVFNGRSEGGDPSAVTLEGAFQNELLGHLEVLR